VDSLVRKRWRLLLSVLGLALFFASSATAVAGNSGKKVEWQDVDQLCGQLQLEAPQRKKIIVEGRTELRLYTAYLEAATVALYPATPGEKDCCTGGPMATTRSRSYGVFEFEGVQPGYYWLRVHRNGLTRLIPVHVTNAFDNKACHDSSVRRSVVVDSTPPKIQTRIR
jgi:hypothetical protein